MKKTDDGVTDKIMSLFKTNTTKDYGKPRRIKRKTKEMRDKQEETEQAEILRTFLN